MKRYFRTIILVLVGVLLLASCGAGAPATMEEAAMEERVEAPKMEQRAAPQAEAKEAPIAAEAPKARPGSTRCQSQGRTSS